MSTIDIIQNLHSQYPKVTPKGSTRSSVDILQCVSHKSWVHVSTVFELQLEAILFLHDVEVKTYTKFLLRARLLTRFPASSLFS
jgi:hypothetical protein